MKRLIWGTIGPVLVAIVPLGSATVQAQRVVTGGSFTPAANVLFATDFSQDPVGNFPSGLKFVRGPLDVVLVDGVPMLRAIGEAEFQIPLGQPLPQDFTLEFDLIPKAGNGDDLNIEGGPLASRSVGSAEIRFNHQIASIMGGGQGMSQVTLPYDLQTELINQRSTVQMAMNGTQFKLFVNGRQIYNIPNLAFRRAAVLRVFVGGRDDATNAVYLARIRLATNNPVGVTAAGATSSTPTALSGVTPPPTVTAVGTNRPATPANAPAVTPPPVPPASAPPIGAGQPFAAQAPLAAGVPARLRIGGTPFDVQLVSGGSAAAAVVTVQLPGTAPKKHLGQFIFEPWVLDIVPGTPMDAWIGPALIGNALRTDGTAFGGVIPNGQQLDFRDALITAVTFPTLDAANSAAGYIRVTMNPESVTQASLTGPTGASPGARLAVWSPSRFSLAIGNLERSILRVESFTVTIPTVSSQVGAQRNVQQTTGTPDIPSLLVTFADTRTSPAVNWRAWYDDFVIKGNNGDSQELTFILHFFDAMGGSLLKLKGSGVGIAALRTVATPSSVVRQMQAELYVERLEIVP